MEDSPNSLKTRQTRKSSTRRPMYIALGFVLALLAALFYALEQADRRLQQKAAEDSRPTIDERALVQGQGRGVIFPPPPRTELVAATEAKEEKREPLVVVMKESDPDKEAEALRRRREQQYIAALSSPLLVKSTAGTSAEAPQRSAADRERPRGRESGDGLGLPGTGSQNYDPAADKDKEGFFSRADVTEGGDGWLSRYTREDGRLLEIKTGTVIPAVMVSGINSDLPGVMIAQVSQNVFNTANGKYLLIPQGAKLYGVYDSRVVYGQERVLVAWNRIIFPDGSSVTLGAMPGADMGGYAGFKDKVNNHYVRIFGTAVLMSAVIGTTAYAVDQFNDNGDGEEVSFQDELGTALANQMGTAAMQILQRNLGIAPTLEIRPGYQFNVVATKDVVFSEPYIPHDYEAAYE